MEKRPTKKEMFDMIESLCSSNPQVVEFCQHEKELLAKKNTSSSKVNADTIAIMDLLKVELANIARPVTISELMTSSEAIATYVYGKDNQHLSNQKISALLNKMVDTKEVIKTIDKKKSYFSINLEK